jgi:hypothetical protein
MTSAEGLGRLQLVELRKVWGSESGDFTPWLAKDENLKLLADTLGMELEYEAHEEKVGPFRADIVCVDTADGSKVLIENQLERTDHSHLGQLLTYASGLQAVTIVWIAERFTDEHRAALDWLNEITGEEMSFFGLEIELWRIGDSPVAPKFNIVSKPNDWVKDGGGGGGGGHTAGKLLQKEYWTALREYLVNAKSGLRPQKAHPHHWLTVSIGRSNIHLAALINTSKRRIAVEIYMSGPEAKKRFKALESQRAQIEAEFGAPLDWRELPLKEASRILVLREDTSIDDRAAWPEQHKWLAAMLEKMSSVFKPRVMAMTSADVEEVAE